MAGDDALAKAARDSTEGTASNEGVTVDSAKALEDQLHATVMARLEDILTKQETDMWRRGQEAVAQLQKDRKTVMSTLNELQTRQAELLAQQAEMNRALLDISGKLGLVEEMSKALCGVTMPAHATSDGAGETREGISNNFEDILVDSAEGHALPPLLLSSATSVSAIGPDMDIAACAAAQAASAAAAALESAGYPGIPSACDAGEGPRTPPRGHKSPAVLSLASALTPQQTPAPERRGPPRLSLADHLSAKEPSLPKLRADAPAFVPGEAC